MLYIITALYAEASPFIKHYNLKRDRLFNRHELYSDEHGDILLLITRPGKIPAAMAVTELLVTHVPDENDFLVNIGVCGVCDISFPNDTPNHTSADNVYEGNNSDITSQACICTDILDHDTSRHYYPDMLFKHPFREAGIETCSVVINDKTLVTMPLVDMEAAAIFQAAASFFAPHRMAFLKIPSDNLTTEKVTKDAVSDVIANALPGICEWFENFIYCNASGYCTTMTSLGNFTAKEQVFFEELSAKLNLSVTMQEQLRQLFIYRKLTNGTLEGITLPDIPEGRITNQKRTSLFEEFKQQFL